MSEMYGRRLPYIISWPLFAAFCAPSAFVNNIAVIIMFRFLAGCCAACSSNNCVGIVADMYTTKDVRARSLGMLIRASSFVIECHILLHNKQWHGLR